MFWFYIIILSSHIINGLLTGFAHAILRNTGPWSFSTALASSGCTKTAVLYFSVWPSHPVKVYIYDLILYFVNGFIAYFYGRLSLMVRDQSIQLISGKKFNLFRAAFSVIQHHLSRLKFCCVQTKTFKYKQSEVLR